MELEVARTKSSLNSWLKAKRGIRLMTIEWKEMPKKNPGRGGQMGWGRRRGGVRGPSNESESVTSL